MLDQRYVCTDAHPQLAAAARRGMAVPAMAPVVGVYNDGLLSVFDEAFGKTLLDPWRSRLGADATAIVGTAFGDLYIWDGKGVSFLDASSGGVAAVDPEVEWFLNDYLIQPEAVGPQLQADAFQETRRRLGTLAYGAAFVPDAASAAGFRAGDLAEHHRRAAQVHAG